MTSVADQVNKLGRFDAVIHNAGIGNRKQKLVKTTDGLPHLFAVNTLAPYILTALIIARFFFKNTARNQVSHDAV